MSSEFVNYLWMKVNEILVIEGNKDLRKSSSSLCHMDVWQMSIKSLMEDTIVIVIGRAGGCFMSWSDNCSRSSRNRRRWHPWDGVWRIWYFEIFWDGRKICMNGRKMLNDFSDWPVKLTIFYGKMCNYRLCNYPYTRELSIEGCPRGFTRWTSSSLLWKQEQKTRVFYIKPTVKMTVPFDQLQHDRETTQLDLG